VPDRETEVKVRVDNLSDARSRLKKAGLQLTHSRALEDNFLLDTPDRSLRKQRSILRLRRYGRQWIVTFKGTPSQDEVYKSRVEIEMGVSEPHQIRKIFESLGYHVAFRYQKYRTHYAPVLRDEQTQRKRVRTGYEVVLDETPIGIYLELEGSRKWIDQIAAKLGYTRSDYITKSYGALYLEDCQRKKVKPGDMVFASTIRNRR
jgi:adenylate cyclase class 2